MKNLFSVIFILTITLSSYLSAQTNWEKYPTNPILSQGQPGSWSDEGFPFTYVMEIEDTLRMWFTASDQFNDRIGFATSIDGISWNLHTDTLLDVGPAGTFDEEGVFGAQIVYDGIQYRMWYNGYDTQPYYAGNLRVGYATSPDGINWTKYGNTPVLDLGTSGSWDSFWAYVNTVLYEDGEYKMWYSGFDGLQGLGIGYATSSDGINWTKYSGNPVMSNGSPGVWDAVHVQNPRVIHNGSIYEMWYNGSNGSNGNAVGYATSSDGINWTKHTANPVLLLGSPGSFDSQWAWSPSILLDGSVYKMWYSGYDGNSYRIGYATDSTLVSSVPVENQVLNGFKLHQNYPNPFNPSTSIQYAIGSTQYVSLKVYDVLGNEITTLVNGEQDSGSHSINFDAAQISSGIYFYRLNAGKFSETKSMILIK